MDTKNAARELQEMLPPNWYTETDGPLIYAYPGTGYGPDGPRMSSTLYPLEFGQGWEVEVATGNPGFHGPAWSEEAGSLSEAREILLRGERQYDRRD